MDLDNEELEATKNKTADEMFKKLGYELIEHEKYCFYYKELITNAGEMETYHIEFNYETGTVAKTFGDDNTVENVTMQELQAIYQKCKELGWI